MRVVCLAGVVLSMTALTANTAAADYCPTPPSAVRDLDIPRFYSDAAGSKVEPGLKGANEAAVAPLVGFVREVGAKADSALKAAKPDKRQAEAQCALAWLTVWARGNAWLGSRVSQQGEAQRKWDLAGVSLAYLKVKQHATQEQRRAIEPWLTEIAGNARGYFDSPDRKRNNHWYWLGLSLGGVGLAAGNERYWSEARRIMQDAARDIRADGSLPMELARGERALHYHAFAAMPLVVLAEIAATRGEDFYALGDGALHRLVALTLKGFAEPAIFDRLSGVKQALVPSSPGSGWLLLYQRRFPDRVAATAPQMRPSDRRLGGDVTLLIQMLEQRRAASAYCVGSCDGAIQ